MRRVFITLVAIFLLGPCLLYGTPQIQQYFMTKGATTTCPPISQAATSFDVTEKEATLIFIVNGVNVGDVYATEYYTPAGQFYATASGAWPPIGAGDAPNQCFIDLPFEIAGNPPATMLGTWTVKGKLGTATLFTLTFTISSGGGGGGGTGSTVAVDAKSNIFMSGRSTAPFSGLMPPLITIPSGNAGNAVTFSSVTGTATCNGSTSAGPDGAQACSDHTDINSYQGIAGIYHPSKTLFLVGVFLDNSTPADPAPARLDYRNLTDTSSSFSPQLRQVFFIGDGKTGTGSGSLQQFVIPSGATRLYLGIADAGSFAGNPGYYEDNTGSYTATYGIGPSSGGGGGTTGLSMTINQVIDTACPNNKIIVSVTSSGSAVTGLTAANFTLKENGGLRAVTVTSVGQSSSGALSLAILIDVSGSMYTNAADLPNEKAAAKQLISQMSSSDQVAIYSFTDTVKLLQDFTNDKTRLNAAVDSASGGGDTALYRAIQTAAQALGARSGRKAMVLMTDGEDTIGGVTIDQAIAAAKAAGVPVFPVGFGSALTSILTRIATETGGFYSTAANSADLQRILQSIGQVITSQYEISYTSGSATTDNTVDITVSYGGQTASTFRVVSKCGSSTGCTGGTTGVNLLQNGDAESGSANGDNAQPNIPGWNTDGKIAVIGYNSGSDLSPSTPGPANRGNNYFGGGPSGNSAMTQTIDLSAYASAIDAGTQPYTLDGWLGGYSSQGDNTVVQVTFKNASGASLGTDTIGPVTSADRNNNSALVERTSSKNVPAGTRKALITVTFTRTDGSYNDGLADNLYFGLTSGGSSTTPTIAVSPSALDFGTITVGQTSDKTITISNTGCGTLTVGSLGITGPFSLVSPPATPLTVPTTGVTLTIRFSPTASGPLAGTLSISSNDPSNTSKPVALTGSGSSGGSTGLTMTISQVIDSACPNNKIIVSVMSSGSAVTGLTAANFTLKENGGLRAITVTPVGGSSSGALSLAILIDVSGSLNSTDLANEKAAAKQLISQLSASDSVAVYSFTDDVRLLLDFTNNKALLNAAVDSAAGGGLTALYKAIQTASLALGARTGRKSIVLMTDGADTIGGVTIDQAIAAAKAAGVPVFPVGFGTANATVLTKIATETGGFYSPAGSSADLQKILGSLGQIISSQYEISYTSGNATSDNNVDITVSYAGQSATASRVVSKCSGGTPGCTYLVQPQALNIPAAGYSGTIIVITQANCALNPSANVSWVHILGFNQGAVSYQVDPNTSSGPRSGILTVGNRGIPVTQDGGVSCGYSLSPSSNQVQSLGTTSSFRVVTGPGCQWSTTVGVGWLHVTSATSGSGPAPILYTVDVNNSTQPRSGTISVAGLAYTVNQSGGAPPNTPTIADGGVVNAASNRGGAIARGSFFTIYGANLGPPGFLQVQNYPIPDTMGGVVVTVSQGSYNKRAYLHFVSSVQINGILPSDTPLGTVQMTVSYNGSVSSSSSLTIVDTSFGVFSAAGGPGPGIVQNFNNAVDVPLNMASFPAKPRQIVILWGTGLGPITTGDNNPPPGGDLPVTVVVTVGGKPANKLYSGRAPNFAGVDNIYFEVPADVPTGCSVPIVVTAGGVTGNTVRMAISADGKRCTDPANPFGSTAATGGKTGVLGLSRIGFSGQLDSSKPAGDFTFDVGLGVFSKVAAGGDLAFSPFMSLPPVGTCTSNGKGIDLGSVMGNGGTGLDTTSQGMLDAGAQLTVTGPNGSVKIEHVDPNTGTGPYISTIGGQMPADGAPVLPKFLEGGAYTISGAGGKDIGAFSTSITLPPPITWTNQGQINTIVRSSGFTVTWTGGDASQTVAIAGGSTNQKTKESGGFVCLAPATAGSFVIPANVLAALPVTGATTGMSDTVGVLAVMALPMSNPQKFTAPGLDSGLVTHTVISAKTVQVQ